MKTRHAITVAAAMLAGSALVPAAHAMPPNTNTYQALVCDADGVGGDLHVVGSTRLWDDDGNGYLVRYISQTVEIEGVEYGPFSRSWGRGADSNDAITCTGGGFDLQGFWVTSIEMVIVPLT